MATFNRVDLNGPSKLDEHKADGAVRPGDLLSRSATGVDHTTVAGQGGVLFAAHDRLQGKTIDDNYAAGDMVQCFAPQRGDLVWAWLADEENIVAGAPLTNTATGALSAATVGTHAVVGYAEESLDLTGAAGDARLIVRIA